MKPVDVEIGMNRTGIDMSPVDSKETIQGAKASIVPPSPGDETIAARMRLDYASKSETIGSVPPPGTLKGAVKTTVDMVKGKEPTIFIDKLGERLAFERTGVRLYDALLVKFDASEVWQGGPTRVELENIRADEFAHFQMLSATIRELGADPTAMTPCADVMGVASMGLMQVLTDPRTTLPQGLSAILTAELTDNDGWEMLIQLARTLGKDDFVTRFMRARDAEIEHLTSVRRWLVGEVDLEARRKLAA